MANEPPSSTSIASIPLRTQHTAGATNLLPDSPNSAPPPEPVDVSFGAAVKKINTDSFVNVHKSPCARQAFLTGIASGFAFGGVKLVLRASVFNACSWASGMFCLTSAVIWEACRLNRGKERDGMIRAMQIIEYKKQERERQLEERREKARLRKEEEERLKKEAEKRWWKPWS